MAFVTLGVQTSWPKLQARLAPEIIGERPLNQLRPETPPLRLLA